MADVCSGCSTVLKCPPNVFFEAGWLRQSLIYRSITNRLAKPRSHTASALTTQLRSYRGTEQGDVPGDPNGSALSGLGPDPKLESP